MEKLEINVPRELLERMEAICELLGFRSREEFVVAAIRRFVDRFLLLKAVGVAGGIENH